MAFKQYKEIDAFGWKLRERINSVIESMKKEKRSQNLSNKENYALRNLIKTKNDKIVMNDTDKNMGAADANKSDVIFECARQLNDAKHTINFRRPKSKTLSPKYKQNSEILSQATYIKVTAQNQKRTF